MLARVLQQLTSRLCQWKLTQFSLQNLFYLRLDVIPLRSSLDRRGNGSLQRHHVSIRNDNRSSLYSDSTLGSRGLKCLQLLLHLLLCLCSLRQR